jgi:hypothetical protein
VPRGIDPGFQTNPGQTRLANLQRHLDEALTRADPAIARAAARDMAGSWRARRIIDQSASGSVPVAMLDGGLQAALKAETKVVHYSRETVDAQQHHPEVEPDSLPIIADLIRSVDVYLVEIAGKITLEFFGTDERGKM